ncbi:MAG: glycosyltransferase, partial [Ferruginibacter sp.]
KIIVLAFQYPFVSKESRWENVHVISFNGRNKGKAHRLFLWMRVWKSIKRIVQENNVIGLLNLWLGECALLGKYASKKTGLPSFTWILGQDAKANNRYVKLVKPAPKDLIAMSDSLSETLEKNYKIKPQHVIPLGIDQTLFTEPLSKRDIDILGAGSLIPLKQYNIFIKIVIEISKQRPTVQAVIVGDGKEKLKLEKLIADNKMENNIRLLGSKEHHEVLSYMHQSKILLHPSNYEGFSAVCAEALYAGAKVVSFTKAMNKDFKNWFVVETEKEMLAKTEAILDCDAVYERVLVNDSEAAARQILALYQK